MERLSPEILQSIPPKRFGPLVRETVAYLLDNANSGLLDGTLELMDPDAISALKGAAFTATVGDVSGADVKIDTSAWEAAAMNEPDQHVQEDAALLLGDATRRAEIVAAIGGIGFDRSVPLTQIIEDWETRYEHEEGHGPS